MGTPANDSHLPNTVLGASAAVQGMVCRGVVTHIHVVLQNLWGGLALLSKAQLILDGLSDGIHIWDLTARLSQDPPHGRELGQGDPVRGSNTHLSEGVCRGGICGKGAARLRSEQGTRQHQAGEAWAPASTADPPRRAALSVFPKARGYGERPGGCQRSPGVRGSWGEAPPCAGWGGVPNLPLRALMEGEPPPMEGCQRSSEATGSASPVSPQPGRPSSPGGSPRSHLMREAQDPTKASSRRRPRGPMAAMALLAAVPRGQRLEVPTLKRPRRRCRFPVAVFVGRAGPLHGFRESADGLKLQPAASREGGPGRGAGSGERGRRLTAPPQPALTPGASGRDSAPGKGE